MYFGIDLFYYLGWLEKFLRPVRGRGERYRDSYREIRICGVIFITLMLLGGLVREETIQSIPGQARRLDQRDLIGRTSVRRIYGGNWIQPHHLFYFYRLRSWASSAWGLVNLDSSPLQPTEWNRAMGLGSGIKILVQSLYFMTLWTRVLYLGDVMRLLVLGLGTTAWIQGYHLYFYKRRVSVLGGSWLNSGMGSGRILLLLAIFYFPAFPGTRVFPALGEGGVSMDIDDTNIRDEQMPQVPNQPPSNAGDAELAELFRYDIRDIREDRHLQASDGHAGNTGQEFFCPIEGSARNRGSAPPWNNGDALRAHIDLHCIGEFRTNRRPNGCGSSVCRIAGFVVGP